MMGEVIKVFTPNAAGKIEFTKDELDKLLKEVWRWGRNTMKEQQPRLLTMEEITGGGECWFEGINGACGYADCYMCTGSQEVEVNRISRKPEYVLWEDFMKKWRCWTSRPTDEQRKAVKWDASD